MPSCRASQVRRVVSICRFPGTAVVTLYGKRLAANAMISNRDHDESPDNRCHRARARWLNVGFGFNSPSVTNRLSELAHELAELPEESSTSSPFSWHAARKVSIRGTARSGSDDVSAAMASAASRTPAFVMRASFNTGSSITSPSHPEIRDHIVMLQRDLHPRDELL